MSSKDNIINATSSSSGTTAVDDISNEIGRMGISNDDGDVSESNISGGEEEKISNEKGTSCEQKLESAKTINVSHDNTGIDIVSGDIGSDIDSNDICANCGKEGASNICNKCKQVKYCNAVCKKKHRTKHKKACERQAAELYDEELFKQPPLYHGDCPICFLRLPWFGNGKRYQSCCGKIICSGCLHAMEKTNKRKLCPFCRIPSPATDKEIIKRVQKRVKRNDAAAIYNLGDYYYEGTKGLPQDHRKAFELYHRAAELGSAESMANMGRSYFFGEGVGRDVEKAMHYFELGAMMGDDGARVALGYIEQNLGNMDRALRHHMIAVGSGCNASLKRIQQLYSGGQVTRDEYTKALRAYQDYLNVVKSSQRDKAAAATEEFRYIG